MVRRFFSSEMASRGPWCSWMNHVDSAKLSKHRVRGAIPGPLKSIGRQTGKVERGHEPETSALSRFEFRVVDLAKGPAAKGSLARSTTINPNSLS